MNNEGFTLVELIIVIAILAIISAVAAPNIIFAVNNARISSDLYNARVISDSLQQVISKDNGIHRVDFTDVEFVEDVTGESAEVEALVEAAFEGVQKNPRIKYGPDSGSPFNVTIGGSSGISVKAGNTILYPKPEGDWAN